MTTITETKTYAELVAEAEIEDLKNKAAIANARLAQWHNEVAYGSTPAIKRAQKRMEKALEAYRVAQKRAGQ